jgi:2-keto-4-pentenoate hydratase
MAFVDPLAQALWNARANARTITAPSLDDRALTRGRARAIASELYAELISAGARQIGWKLIATDERAQAWLGTKRALSAPVFNSSTLTDGAVISLCDLVAPRLELEVALRFAAHDVLLPLACIEIIDTRFPDWRVKVPEAIADFALQGLMIFGSPCADVSVAEVQLKLNGRPLVSGSRSVADASAALAVLTARQRAKAANGQFTVAAGAIVTPVPLTVGSWCADFGDLGSLAFEVIA